MKKENHLPEGAQRPLTGRESEKYSRQPEGLLQVEEGAVHLQEEVVLVHPQEEEHLLPAIEDAEEEAEILIL